MVMNKRKKSAMMKKKKKRLPHWAAVNPSASTSRRRRRRTKEQEEEEEDEDDETEQQPKKEDEETRTDKVLKLARDGEKTLEREAIKKSTRRRLQIQEEVRVGDPKETSSAMSETDEEALEIENNAADKYYDVTKVERLAQETLKRRAGFFKVKRQWANNHQRKRWKKPLESPNQSPDVTRKELFSTLGHKTKEEFINAARLKKLVELKHIATTCKPTLADGSKAMERAKEAAQQAAMKVKQAAARRAELGELPALARSCKNCRSKSRRHH